MAINNFSDGELLTAPRMNELVGQLNTRYYTVDQTAGRVVKVWDYLNSRDQMVYSDTGSRSVAEWFPSPATVGVATLQREWNTVSLNVLSLVPNLTGVELLAAGVIPAGFRPSVDLQGYAVINDINKRPYDGAFTPRSNGSARYYAASNTQRINISIRWNTIDPWPTTLPGTAAGSIPA